MSDIGQLESAHPWLSNFAHEARLQICRPFLAIANRHTVTLSVDDVLQRLSTLAGIFQ